MSIFRRRTCAIDIFDVHLDEKYVFPRYASFQSVGSMHLP